jgi:hypothetical protein
MDASTLCWHEWSLKKTDYLSSCARPVNATELTPRRVNNTPEWSD